MEPLIPPIDSLSPEPPHLPLIPLRMPKFLYWWRLFKEIPRRWTTRFP